MCGCLLSHMTSKWQGGMKTQRSGMDRGTGASVQVTLPCSASSCAFLPPTTWAVALSILAIASLRTSLRSALVTCNQGESMHRAVADL